MRKLLVAFMLILLVAAGYSQVVKTPKPKPIEEIAGPDYVQPKWCSDAPPNTDCLVTSGASVGGWASVGYDEIRLANGKTKLVITCNDETNKPKPCWTPPVPHPETLSECLLRRYRTYEAAFNDYINPVHRGMSRGYTEDEKQAFIRTMAALDESGKEECKGKPVK